MDDDETWLMDDESSSSSESNEDESSEEELDEEEIDEREEQREERRVLKEMTPSYSEYSEEDFSDLVSNQQETAPAPAITPSTSQSRCARHAAYVARREASELAKSQPVDAMSAQLARIDLAKAREKNSAAAAASRFVCAECGKACCSYLGIKIHYGRMHKGKQCPSESDFE